MQNVVCPECSTSNPATNNFCTKCGVSLQITTETHEVASALDQAKPERSRGRCLIVITAAVIAVCICITAMGTILLLPSEDEPTPIATVTDVATTPSPVITRTRPADGAEMVFVPAGEFPMGSADDDPDANDDEKPQHIVYLDAFWIDKTEVTHAQYDKCVEAGACVREGCWFYNRWDWPSMPVLCVTWDGAQAYADWVGGRLPTEAEWEKAARGTDGRIYPWGNSQPDHYKANYLSGVVGALQPVGARLDGASPYGALDMAGNAAEWVADWYDEDYYSRSVRRNPKGPDSGEYRVSRGGNMSSQPRFVRSAYRARSVPNGEYTSNGFRVCVPAQQE